MITFVVWLVSDAKNESQLLEKADFVRGLNSAAEKTDLDTLKFIKKQTFATVKELFWQTLQARKSIAL